jgi:hypothetical protein
MGLLPPPVKYSLSGHQVKKAPDTSDKRRGIPDLDLPCQRVNAEKSNAFAQKSSIENTKTTNQGNEWYRSGGKKERVKGPL